MRAPVWRSFYGTSAIRPAAFADATGKVFRSDMRVLVTGLNGFTGRYMRRALEEHGHQVAGLASDLATLWQSGKRCMPSGRKPPSTWRAFLSWNIATPTPSTWST